MSAQEAPACDCRDAYCSIRARQERRARDAAATAHVACCGELHPDGVCPTLTSEGAPPLVHDHLCARQYANQRDVDTCDCWTRRASSEGGAS